MAVTGRQVAAMAGTSTAVVSYVFNDGPRPVAADTRRRVLEAAETLGYRPNNIARALRTSKTGLVGVLVPDASTPYFSALVKDLEAELRAIGKLSLFSNTETTTADEDDLIAAFRGAQVDGIISVASASATALNHDDVIYVFNAPAGLTPTVAVDDAEATRIAYAHLRSHGYADIAFVQGPDDAGPVHLRAEAWAEVAGAEAPIYRSDYSPQSGWVLAAGLIAAGTMPRALVVATDEQALGILAAAYDRGIRIPEDLALISLDGSPLTRFTAPSITATEQPTRPMARAAVQAFLGQPHPSRIPTQLVLRRSCGCA